MQFAICAAVGPIERPSGQGAGCGAGVEVLRRRSSLWGRSGPVPRALLRDSAFSRIKIAGKSVFLVLRSVAGRSGCRLPTVPIPPDALPDSFGGAFLRRGIRSAGYPFGGAFLRRTSLWTATSASDAVNGAARRGCGREAELPPPARFAPVRFAAGPYRSVPVRPVGPARTRSVPVRPGPGSAGGGAKCEQFDLKGNKRQWMR